VTKLLEYGYFCPNPPNGILRNDKNIIKDIFCYRCRFWWTCRKIGVIFFNHS